MELTRNAIYIKQLKEQMYNLLAPSTYTVSCCDQAQPCVQECAAPPNMERKMFDDDFGPCEDTRTPDERKTSYLISELHDERNNKYRALWNTYNMDGTPTPSSPKEFVEMIKDGKFQFTKDYLNDDGSWRTDNHPYSWAYNIWNYLKPADPAKEPKREEFKAAEKLLDKAYLDAEREIRIAAPADGLKTLKDFEAKTFN